MANYAAQVPAFNGFDGTPLTYHVAGEGPPLICLPGGPMRASGISLTSSGGLSRHRRLLCWTCGGRGIPRYRRTPRPTVRSQIHDMESLRQPRRAGPDRRNRPLSRRNARPALRPQETRTAWTGSRLPSQPAGRGLEVTGRGVARPPRYARRALVPRSRSPLRADLVGQVRDADWAAVAAAASSVGRVSLTAPMNVALRPAKLGGGGGLLRRPGP